MCCFIIVLPDASYQVPQVFCPYDFNSIQQPSNLSSIHLPAGLPNSHSFSIVTLFLFIHFILMVRHLWPDLLLKQVEESRDLKNKNISSHDALLLCQPRLCCGYLRVATNVCLQFPSSHVPHTYTGTQKSNR